METMEAWERFWASGSVADYLTYRGLEAPSSEGDPARGEPRHYADERLGDRHPGESPG